jgi:hypothetical protein
VKGSSWSCALTASQQSAQRDSRPSTSCALEALHFKSNDVCFSLLFELKICTLAFVFATCALDQKGVICNSICVIRTQPLLRSLLHVFTSSCVHFFNTHPQRCNQLLFLCACTQCRLAACWLSGRSSRATKNSAALLRPLYRRMLAVRHVRFSNVQCVSACKTMHSQQYPRMSIIRCCRV